MTAPERDRGEVYVDKSSCVGSGGCVAVAPHVFRLDDDGWSEVHTPPDPEDPAVLEAIDQCPVEAIRRRGLDG